MVTILRIALLFLVFPSLGVCEILINYPAKISVTVDSAVEGNLIRGHISIIRLREQKIDDASFLLGNDPLKVELVSELSPLGHGLFGTSDPDALVVSLYRFILPPKPYGLYILPPVSVNVGGYNALSDAITYEVHKQIDASKFFLEGFIKDPPPFYPGQHLHFVYKIHYNQPIDLTLEELPLLSAEGFRNIGAPKIVMQYVGQEAIQVIEQEVVALSSGTFTIPSSVIEGFTYQSLANGGKEYVQPKLRSETPALVVQISDFPEQSKPISFNGALGNFQWSVKLQSLSSIVLGDKFILEVSVTGEGELDTVKLPDLSRQKSFKEQFKWGDLNIPGEDTPFGKQFIFELRPLNTSIQEIPTIEFSSFDPNSRTYHVMKTLPIAVNVVPKRGSSQEDDESYQMSVPANRLKIDNRPPPIEIQDLAPLYPDTIHAKHISYTTLVIASVACLFLYISQLAMSKWAQHNRQKQSLKRSGTLLEHAQYAQDFHQCGRLVQEALLLRLFEQGVISDLRNEPQLLSRQGIEGKVRKFLEKLQAARFSGKQPAHLKDFVGEAKQLYKDIHLNPSSLSHNQNGVEPNILD